MTPENNRRKLNICSSRLWERLLLTEGTKYKIGVGEETCRKSDSIQYGTVLV